MTAVNDDIDNPSDRREATITHALTGVGSGYESGATVADVTVTVTDDDTKGVTISETTLDVGENVGTGTYTVKLNSKPTGGNVTVGVSSGTSAVAVVSSASLTFTAIDWAKPQTVTVTGVNDNIDNKQSKPYVVDYPYGFGDRDGLLIRSDCGRCDGDGDR